MILVTIQLFVVQFGHLGVLVILIREYMNNCQIYVALVVEKKVNTHTYDSEIEQFCFNLFQL